MDTRQELKNSILEAHKAAARVESYPNDQVNSATGLLSPRSTPPPDDENSIEELQKDLNAKSDKVINAIKTQQQEELKRISSCSSDAHDDILGAKDAEDKDKDRIRTENWVLLGCLLHPNINDKFNKVFQKLQSAAKKVEVDNLYIELVNNWDVNTMPPMHTVAGGITNQEEIKRILACVDDEYDEILGVGPDVKEEEKKETRERNWKTKGIDLHPRYCRLKKAKEAFKKLEDAARKTEIDDAAISMVKQWDGKEDLFNVSEDDEDDDDEDQRPLPGNIEIPEPTAETNKVYQQATEFMKMLIRNPSQKEPLRSLEGLNKNIKEDAKLHHIHYQNFQRHYQVVFEAYKTLFELSGEEYPNDKIPENGQPSTNDKLERARRDILGARNLIEEIIIQFHYPMDWSIPDVEYYRDLLKPETDSSENQRSETESTKNSSSAVIEFPNYGENWLTIQYNDTSRIIGWRPVGGFGKLACIERKENGRLIRRLIAASECGAGLRMVDDYSRTEGNKEFSKGQSDWYKKDGDDFVKLHWVTQSVTKNSSKDPATYCCVEFREKGMNILTASKFRQVVTRDTANIEIKRVCDRDHIPVPWERGCLDSTDYSPAKMKDPNQRFAAIDEASWNKSSRPKPKPKDLKDKTSSGEDLTAQSPTANELSSINERITNLESTMQLMQKTLAALEKLSTHMVHQEETNRKILDILTKNRPDILDPDVTAPQAISIT